MTYLVEFRTEPARAMAAVRFHCTMTELGMKLGSAFGSVAGYLARTGRGPSGPAIAHYRMTGETIEVAAGFEVAEPIKAHGEIVPFELPAGEVAVTTHLGPYSDLPKAYQALQDQAFVAGHRIDETAPMWERYHSGPDTPPDEICTEVFWPLVAQ